MKLKLFYSLFILMLFCCGLTTTVSAQRSCGTDNYMKQMLQDPAFADKFYKKRAEALVSAEQKAAAPCSNPLIIPVAIHYHNPITAANTACLIAAAQAQIDQMNLDFSACNANASDLCDWINAGCNNFGGTAGGDAMPDDGACIKFCLGDQNLPAGEDNIGGFAITVGDYTWNTSATNTWSGWMNVFVSSNNQAGHGLGDILGVAPLGGASNPNGNGVFVVFNAFGSQDFTGCTSGGALDSGAPYDGGATLTHEVGHYFGLEHTFSDNLADTPAQNNPNYGCPTVNTTNCTASGCTNGACNGYAGNFMDYVDDDCMHNFSADQVTLMQTVAANQNVWETNSVSCDNSYSSCNAGPCTTSPPVADFTPNSGPITICAGSTIAFSDQSANGANQWSWSFSGTSNPSPASSTAQNPIVTPANSGTLIVTLTATNSVGSDTAGPTTINVTIDNNCAVGCLYPGNYDTNNHTAILYTYNDGTYVSGSNSFGDIAKAEALNLSDFGICTPSTLTGALVCFGHADAGATGTLEGVIWGDAGGSPGAALAAVALPMATVIADVGAGNCTFIDFSSSPVTINGPFYVGVSGFNTVSGGDVAILTNSIGESTTNTGWEQWDDNTWNDYNSAIGQDLSHAIFPEILPQAPVAAFTAPGSLCDDGTSYTFTNTTSTPLCSGTAPTYEWTLCDSNGNPVGATQTTTDATFSFTAAGMYTVKLCVTGASCETDCENQTIMVTNCGTNCYSALTNSNGLSTTETSLSTADYESSDWISTNAPTTIQSGAVVDYDAVDYIELNADFTVEQGAVFNAFIDGCNNGAGGSNFNGNNPSQLRTMPLPVVDRAKLVEKQIAVRNAAKEDFSDAVSKLKALSLKKLNVLANKKRQK